MEATPKPTVVAESAPGAPEAEGDGVRPIPGWVRSAPIAFFLTYLTVTVLLFAAGPWVWPVDDGTKLYVFLAAAHLALLLGYARGTKRQPGGYSGKWSPRQLTTASLVVTLVLLLPTSLSRTGSLIPNVVRGIADPFTAYSESNAAREAAGGNLIEYSRIFLAPILFLLLPLTVFYWQRVGRGLRWLAMIALLGFLSIYVAIGTNKAIADFVLLVPCMAVASYLAGEMRVTRRQLGMLGAGAVGVFAAFLVLFATGNASRLTAGSLVDEPVILGEIDMESPVVRWLPEWARLGALSLSSYMSQGYYGLYLALDEPFEPMYGVGNSPFLYFNASRITGDTRIEKRPYPVRVEAHAKWDAYANWSSIYPWIASDVSFFGAIGVVFLIGYGFAMAWADALRARNPFAVAMLAQFVIMLFYFPANNQTMLTGEALFAFYGVLGAWLYTRKPRGHEKDQAVPSGDATLPPEGAPGPG